MILMKAKHTKLPWELRSNIPYSTAGFTIFSGRGEENRTICRLPYGNTIPAPTEESDPRCAENAANARLIVTAVNSHGELLAACKAALNIAHYTTNELCALKVDDKQRALIWTDKVHAIEQSIKAAIAKAEGEQ